MKWETGCWIEHWLTYRKYIWSDTKQDTKQQQQASYNAAMPVFLIGLPGPGQQYRETKGKKTWWQEGHVSQRQDFDIDRRDQTKTNKKQRIHWLKIENIKLKSGVYNNNKKRLRCFVSFAKALKRRGRESFFFKKRGEWKRKKKNTASVAANLPSTKSWPRCRSIAAIWWSLPRFCLPLRCQQASSDASALTGDKTPNWENICTGMLGNM